MRISRALALFRPSFIALIMNLTEEDLVFMEKCLQRTLLVGIILLTSLRTAILHEVLTPISHNQEYEKLISFSGTPTVVWRRTGEICLVGKEFSLLTNWSKDALLGKKKYIYEVSFEDGLNYPLPGYSNTSLSVNGQSVSGGVLGKVCHARIR